MSNVQLKIMSNYCQLSYVKRAAIGVRIYAPFPPVCLLMNDALLTATALHKV